MTKFLFDAHSASSPASAAISRREGRGSRSIYSRSFFAFFALALSFGLAGCATPSGQSAASITVPAIAAAYLPLSGHAYLGLAPAAGAAVVIAPGIAVTNDHNANLVDPKIVLGFGSLSDLMFFRTARKAAPNTAVPVAGESVTAYGQSIHAGLRIAHGVICEVVHVAGYSDSPYFIFAGDAGPGFSGGPVLDADGHLVGITWGYVDDTKKNTRLIFAYDVKRIWAEFQLKKPRRYEPKDQDTSPPATGYCGQQLSKPAQSK